ncbi:ATP-binding cassette transporter sub-family A, partial [Elysia marginata]
MGFASQLGLLLWKNWILQKRRICVTIFEVILPVFFAVLIVLIRLLVKTKDIPNPTTYSTNSVAINASRFEPTTIVGYAPNTSETDIVMQFVLGMLENRTVFGSAVDFSIQGFSTEELALDFVSSNPKLMRHMVVFDSVSASSTSLPKNMDVSIRPYSGSDQWRTEFTYPFFQTNEPRKDDFPEYRQSGFNFLQALVGEALAKYWLQKDGGDPDSIHFGAYLRRMPYPPYFDDPMIQVLQGNLPLFLVLSFILSVIINTKNLVFEKERKLKESMKLMGLRASVHWLSWFVTFAVYLVPALAIYALLFGLNLSGDKGPVLANTDATLFFVFLLCYGFALLTFCFMVSTFVQKANVGAALAGILFFGFFFPWYFVQPNYENLGKGTKLASGLLFNCAMALGSNVIGIYEGTGEGAKWNNFHKPGVVDDNLSLLECMLLLLFDSLIHCIIAWYLDNVRPGEFGVPKPFYFPFTRAYWVGPKASSNSMYEYENADTKHFEKDPTGLNAGIQIAQLRKVFGKKVAVDGTSLKMYDGQITVLLGHNGAGKTTTMSMLTGFIPPTSGTAQVNGCDIRDDIQGVRKSLGLCPQHNILFDSLTVKEHLTFFAKLKGVYGSEMEKEVMSTVKEVGLETKIHCRSHGLSGGQKRKLSVGIALIGGSKIVILDEPTSGMDPAARRQTWNVLQRARQGRTVVLSTHYMDEADLLGDRIAIMAEGVIKCCGSSMFLKKLYGAGYHLVVVKRSDCNVDSLTRVVQSHVPTAELESVINTEVSYILPDSESPRFPALFTELDDHKDQLGITSFGTSATTMEEVFLKVGESAYDDEEGPVRIGTEAYTNNGPSGAVNSNFENDEKLHLANSEEDMGSDHANGKLSASKTASTEQVEMSTMDMMCKPSKVRPLPEINAFNKGFIKNTGLSLKLSIIRALFVKKAIHTWRNRVVTLVQLLLPVIFTILGLAADESRPDANLVEPPLTLNLEPYGRTYIPLTAGLNPTSARTNFADLYKAQFGTTQALEPFTEPPDFDNYTLARADDLGTTTYNKKMVIGMESIDPIGSETAAAVAYFNGQPYHGKAVSAETTLKCNKLSCPAKSTRKDTGAGYETFIKNIRLFEEAGCGDLPEWIKSEVKDAETLAINEVVRVQTSSPIPGKWHEFLRNDQNKTELFSFLTKSAITSIDTSKELVMTDGTGVSFTPLSETSAIAPCNHEEANSSMMVHVTNAVHRGCKKIQIKRADTDLAVLIVSTISELGGGLELWVAFGTGKDFRLIAVHEIAESLGPMRCCALSKFHSLMGCDTTSYFQHTDMLTTSLCSLRTDPKNLQDNILHTVKRFLILLYDRTSSVECIDAARRDLFVSKGRKLSIFPPKKAVLYQRILLPDAASSCKELIHCHCRSRCIDCNYAQLNYLMNTFLQSTLNDSFSLQTILAPLPKDPKAAAERNALLAISAGFSIGFFISFGMAFLTTMFIFFLIKERQVGAKHMQVVSGVGPVTYWLPTFMWDFINYIVPSMLLLVVFAAYSKSAYLDDGRFALVILVLAIYGWAVLPFMYALQFAFNSPPTGVVMVIVMNIFSGLVTTTAVFVLKIPALGTEDIGNTLDWIFMAIFPNYNMASCFSNIYTNYLSLQTCGDVVCSPFKISTCCK